MTIYIVSQKQDIAVKAASLSDNHYGGHTIYLVTKDRTEAENKAQEIQQKLEYAAQKLDYTARYSDKYMADELRHYAATTTVKKIDGEIRYTIVAYTEGRGEHIILPFGETQEFVTKNRAEAESKAQEIRQQLEVNIQNCSDSYPLDVTNKLRRYATTIAVREKEKPSKWLVKAELEIQSYLRIAKLGFLDEKFIPTWRRWLELIVAELEVIDPEMVL